MIVAGYSQTFTAQERGLDFSDIGGDFISLRTHAPILKPWGKTRPGHNEKLSWLCFAEGYNAKLYWCVIIVICLSVRRFGLLNTAVCNGYICLFILLSKVAAAEPLKPYAPC